MPSIDAFMIAIQQREGWFVGSRSWRNNNPGNLRNWSNALPKDDQGYDVFPTVGDGFAALRKQIKKNIDRGLTLYEFFAGKPGVYGGYSPASDGNDPRAYAGYVSRLIKVPVDGVRLNSYGWTDEYELETMYRNVDNRLKGNGSSGKGEIVSSRITYHGTVPDSAGTLNDLWSRPMDLPLLGEIATGDVIVGGIVLVLVLAAIS